MSDLQLAIKHAKPFANLQPCLLKALEYRYLTFPQLHWNFVEKTNHYIVPKLRNLYIGEPR